MSYDLMFQKAIELQNAGALNQAEDIYLKILQVMPENSDVWNLLGLVAQSKGNLTHARDCFLNAIKYAPTPFFAHYFNLGLVYKSLDKPKEAIDAMQQAVKLKEDFKEGWNYLGILKAQNGEVKTAVDAFCKALDIDANYTDTRVNLCFYTNDLNNLIKVADEDKNNYYAQLKAAEIVDDITKKERYLQQALQIAPERVEAINAYADLLVRQGDFNKALTFYHKTLNLDENNIQAILGVADIYLKQKEFTKSEKYYLKSFNITRDIAGAHLNYGTLLYQQKRLSEALEEYRRAVALAPNMPEISYNLALVLKELGDYDEALGLMFNAHLQDKENSLYAINIMETLTALYQQDAEKALKIAENWQKQEPDNIFSQRILNSLSGIADEKADALYTEKLFDSFAETYDDTLQRLNPQIIKTFKKKFPHLDGRILDLGCGTGQAAKELKNAKCSFDGVDLSQKMLEIAQRTGLYNELYHQNIVAFLAKHDTSLYNMVLAFDVFCYLGNLEAVLEKIKKTTICFSVEMGDEDRGEDFYPAPSGRYKHKKSYIESLLKKLKYADFEAILLDLRLENGEPVKGWLFVAKHD